MILAIVPSPVYAPVGSIITGRSDNSGLPDYALFSEYDKMSTKLCPYIGDDFQYKGYPLYKAYAVWDNTLYEYSLMASKIPTLDTQELFYIPISIKKYDNGYRTFLYTKGIETFKNLTKDPEDPGCEIISFSYMFHYLLEKARKDDLFYLDKMRNFVPSVWDMFLTHENPSTMTDLMFELGSTCMGYGTSAIAYLYANFAEDIDTLGQIFSFGDAKDIISAYGCSQMSAFMSSLLSSFIDWGSHSFFTDQCSNHELYMKTVLRDNQVMYLDTHCHLFGDLGILSVLEAVYTEELTDFTMTVSDKLEHASGCLLFGGNQYPSVITGCSSMLISYIQMYNKHNDRKITLIDISKSWLDEFFLTVYYDNGSVDRYFINLALYHLYSPSLLKTEYASMLK